MCHHVAENPWETSVPITEGIESREGRKQSLLVALKQSAYDIATKRRHSSAQEVRYRANGGKLLQGAQSGASTSYSGKTGPDPFSLVFHSVSSRRSLF
jgi:hypothetical protein